MLLLDHAQRRCCCCSLARREGAAAAAARSRAESSLLAQKFCYLRNPDLPSSFSPPIPPPPPSPPPQQDDGDEGLQVDFDQIWKGDDGAEGASSRSSGGRGADFGSAGSQRNQSFGLTTSGDGLGLMQTSDREMDVQLSNP